MRLMTLAQLLPIQYPRAIAMRDHLDVHLCGQTGDLRFRVDTFYHDIQKPIRLQIMSKGQLTSVEPDYLERHDLQSEATLQGAVESIGRLPSLAAIRCNSNSW